MISFIWLLHYCFISITHLRLHRHSVPFPSTKLGALPSFAWRPTLPFTPALGPLLLAIFSMCMRTEYIVHLFLNFKQDKDTLYLTNMLVYFYIRTYIILNLTLEIGACCSNTDIIVVWRHIKIVLTLDISPL